MYIFNIYNGDSLANGAAREDLDRNVKNLVAIRKHHSHFLFAHINWSCNQTKNEQMGHSIHPVYKMFGVQGG